MSRLMMVQGPEEGLEAIFANPNCSATFAGSAGTRNPDAYLTAFCKHGCFEDIVGVSKLWAALKESGRIGERQMGFLVKRAGLPMSVAEVLDKRVSNEHYALLCQTEGDQEFIRQKHDLIKAADLEAQSSRLDSPALSQEQLRAATVCVNSMPDGVLKAASLARIAIHPNTPKGISDGLFDDPDVKPALALLCVGAQHPRAEKVLIDVAETMERDGKDIFGLIGNIANIRDASPQGLEWATDKMITDGRRDLIATTLTHPNFDLEKRSRESMLLWTNKEDNFVALAALYLTGRPLKSVSEDTELAMVFSPKTSSRQLDKIAEDNPEFAAVVACHPNGHGCRVNDDDRQEVERFRSKFPVPTLGGRSEGGGRPVCVEQLSV